MTLCPALSSSLIPELLKLGAGEREALSLAIAISDSLVILDDALARGSVQQLNLSTTGTLGVLLKGKQSRYMEAIAKPVRSTYRSATRQTECPKFSSVSSDPCCGIKIGKRMIVRQDR